ncbi:MAG: DUF3119 family protein [Cyanobacteriota bacterium]
MTPNPEIPSGPGSGAVLNPSFGVPLGVMALGAACLGLGPVWNGAPWLAGIVAVFGAFLALQTALLRLEFTGDCLLVWRQDSLLKHFPYAEWLSWRLFWPGLPVLFYFRERRSIHLLPVLFDAAALQQHLQQHLGHLAPDGAPNG